MIQRLKSIMLTLVLITVGVSVMGWITLNFLLRPSPTTESPELVAAKTQAQLAELARQQASNLWWGDFWRWVAILFVVVALLGSGTILWIVYRAFTHKVWVDQQNHRKSLTIIEPDQLGNYPLVRINGEFHRFRAGNPAFAGPAQPFGLLPEASNKAPRRKMLIQGQEYAVQGDVQDYQPPTPPRANRAPIEANAQNARTVEMRAIENLRTAKEGRRGKIRSIKRYCNSVPGDDDYEKWLIVWDNL